MAAIANPVLRGFSPDPSICRVGDFWYIATSTFEWFPGVQIHRSRDLRSWALAARPLSRPGQLDMRGNPDSGGVWAPCLSHSGGMFWLVYSDMKVVQGAFKEGRNWLSTCESVEGEWSDPVFLNSSGFDASLFHGSDGRRHLVNMVWNHRAGEHPFGGIALQEYCHRRRALVGEPRIVFRGSRFGVTEAPHLYEIGGWHYLLTAEGGTGYGHMATVARSRGIEGPYEIRPGGPLISSRFSPENPFQKAGHGSLAQAACGGWYMAYLMARPIGGDGGYRDKYRQYAGGEGLDRGYCPLGRETSLARVEWRGGWPWVAGGQPAQSAECDLPEHPPEPGPPELDRFEGAELGMQYQTLRIPLGPDMMSLSARPGHLRLFGRESLTSRFAQSHVARRWQSLSFDAAASVAFSPKSPQQMAGIACYYNTQNWTAFYVTFCEGKGRALEVMAADNGEFSSPLSGAEIPVPEGAEYAHLKAEVRGGSYAYLYSFADGAIACAAGEGSGGEGGATGGAISDGGWREVPLRFDSWKLSDDYAKGAAFTGAFAGMFCCDCSGAGLHADFACFLHRER